MEGWAKRMSDVFARSDTKIKALRPEGKNPMLRFFKKYGPAYLMLLLPGKGIAAADPSGNFNPDQMISKQEMAAMTHKAAAVLGENDRQFAHRLDAGGNELNTGYATRAEAARMIYALLSLNSNGQIEAPSVSAAPGDGLALLSWEPAAAVDYYKVYSGTESGVYGEPAIARDSTFTANGLENGKTYYFSVSAVDYTGRESEKSGEIAVRPLRTPVPPVAPPSFVVQGPAATNKEPDTNEVEEGTEQGRFKLDAAWAKAVLEDKALAILVIDLKDVAADASGQRTIVLPAEIIAQAKEAGKPIVLQNETAAWSLPLAGVDAAGDVTVALAEHIAEGTALPADLIAKRVYRVTAMAGATNLSQAGGTITVKLSIPAHTKDADKLAVYRKEADDAWTYIGGRVIDGKLVFETDQFGEYVLVESVRTFTDITDHWAKRTIEVMTARQIVNGVTADKFSPNSKITRAELVALVSRVLKLDRGGTPHSEGAAGKWFETETGLSTAVILGEGKALRPFDPVTREEIAVIVMHAYKLAGGAPLNSGPLTFKDRSSISKQAEEAVAEAQSLGIIAGYPDGSFAPGKEATRAESLSILLKWMDVSKL
ncbi:hypothetical protein EBB07_01270 [Paenibacillaceae bacterium]|nr:hypothetical protein EBB07_01270 [Paenibacillaceae bacterium]